MFSVFFSEPNNLTVSARTNDSLTLTWTSLRKIPSTLRYEATVKHIGESQPLAAFTTGAHEPCEAKFSQLLAYTNFLLEVRACIDKHNCSDTAVFEASTLPSRKLYGIFLKKLFETFFARSHTMVKVNYKALNWF